MFNNNKNTTTFHLLWWSTLVLSIYTQCKRLAFLWGEVHEVFRIHSLSLPIFLSHNFLHKTLLTTNPGMCSMLKNWLKSNMEAALGDGCWGGRATSISASASWELVSLVSEVPLWFSVPKPVNVNVWKKQMSFKTPILDTFVGHITIILHLPFSPHFLANTLSTRKISLGIWRRQCKDKKDTNNDRRMQGPDQQSPWPALKETQIMLLMFPSVFQRCQSSKTHAKAKAAIHLVQRYSLFLWQNTCSPPKLPRKTAQHPPEPSPNQIAASRWMYHIIGELM